MLTEKKVWTSPQTKYEYLDGLGLLFEECNLTDSRASGSHLKVPLGTEKLERDLKCFGGCKFVRRYGYKCSSCGSLERNSEIEGGSYHRCTNFGPLSRRFWRDFIELRKD